MASLVDPDELDIDELVDRDEDDPLTLQFKRAAEHLGQKLLSEGVETAKLLTLYAYYKQGAEGPCNTPKPPFYDFKGKAKWEAWKQLGTLPKNKAKSMYIETIETLDPSFKASGDNENSNAKEQWVKVSTMVKDDGNTDEETPSTLVDLIKEGNVEDVENSLDTYDPKKIKNVVDELDDVGLASIHWAADSGHTNIIDLLLKSGADINRQDSDGQTALHYGASCGHLECVKFLVERGARKDIYDNEGKDPYSVASDDDIKELLKNS